MDTLRQTLTIGETASILGLSPNTVYKLVREGEIPSLRMGRRILIPRDALAKLLKGPALLEQRDAIL